MNSNENQELVNQVHNGQLSAKLAKFNNLIENFATLSQITKLQQIIQSDQSKVELQLKNFVDISQFEINQKIRQLELQRTGLANTMYTFHSVLTNLSGSNNQAKNISEGIKSIENDKILVENTLDFVNKVRLLKSNLEIVNAALKNNNYVLASESINEILQLPKEILESKFVNKVVPTSDLPELPSTLLAVWCEQLSDLFHKNFISAAQNGDIENLTMYFRLFPQIGYSELGLDSYAKYVCDIISEQSRKIITNQSTKPTMFFSQALLHLFKIVSTIINDHSKIIGKCYGIKHMTHIMAKVEKESELQAGLIWDTFMEYREVEKLLRQIDEPEDKLESNDKDDSALLNDIQSITQEFSSILQNWSMYCRFFAVRWNEFIHLESEFLELPDPLISGKFHQKIQANLDKYLKLIYQNLHQSFMKSISLEDMPCINNLLVPDLLLNNDDLSNYPISSVLEDLILLIRSNLILNINTGQLKTLKTFFDNLVKFIQNEYLIKFLQNRLKSIQSKLNPSLFLKKYSPPSSDIPPSNLPSQFVSSLPSYTDTNAKLSSFGFNFKGAATSALTNIHSNLQSVYSNEESILKLHHYLIYINTLGIGEVFFHRLLVKEILEDNPTLLHDNFPFQDDSTLIKNYIMTIEKQIIKQNGKLLTWSLKQLEDHILLPKVKRLITPLFINGDHDYICTSQNFEDLNKLNHFISKWKEFIVPFSNVLYKPIMVQLLTALVDFICKVVEDKIWLIKSNELGSIKLERELSIFIGTICDSHYFLRDKFTKLTQIVLISTFDDDDFDMTTNDIKDEIISSINWILSSDERIMARELRIDKRK